MATAGSKSDFGEHATKGGNKRECTMCALCVHSVCALCALHGRILILCSFTSKLRAPRSTLHRPAAAVWVWGAQGKTSAAGAVYKGLVQGGTGRHPGRAYCATAAPIN